MIAAKLFQLFIEKGVVTNTNNKQWGRGIGPIKE